MKNNTEPHPEGESPEVLCEICGSIMVLEDSKYICPHCDAEIDFFGDDDDELA